MGAQQRGLSERRIVVLYRPQIISIGLCECVCQLIEVWCWWYDGLMSMRRNVQYITWHRFFLNSYPFKIWKYTDHPSYILFWAKDPTQSQSLAFLLWFSPETREGWPLLTVETGQMGTQRVQMKGVLLCLVVGLVVPVREIFLLPWLL
jgi:hypothetical protein